MTDLVHRAAPVRVLFTATASLMLVVMFAIGSQAQQPVRATGDETGKQAVIAGPVSGTVNASPRWWKGNLHTHSLWSDGNDFPEMIAAWYLDHGYHFLAMTDHNVLAIGDRWMRFEDIAKRGGHEAVEKYLERFGDKWVETRGPRDTNLYEVRLKPLNEYRTLLEQPQRFLLMQAEEISDSANRLPIHLNATNLQELIRPVGGQSVREAIENNVRAVKEQSERTGQPIFVHLNHPNFGWAITPADLAHATSEQFFEVYNGHPGVNQLGDETRPSIEKMWDVANTIRLGELKSEPLFGMGTDDSHNYHSASGATSGRGWVMVRAEFLTPEHLIKAMEAGEFYASSGVTLEDVQFDDASQTLTVTIKPEEGVEYETKFIGTDRKFFEAPGDESGKEQTLASNPRVGRVLKTSSELKCSYQMSGDELYVRALITSSKPHPNPSIVDQKEQAWTQPVGWQAGLENDQK